MEPSPTFNYGWDTIRFKENILLNLKIPNRVLKIKKTLNVLVGRAADNINKSRKIYEKAEVLLLEELGINELDLSSKLYFERQYSKLEEAKRMDDGFFQPRHYRLIEKLMNAAKKFDGDIIGNLSEPLKYGTSDKLTYVSKGVPFLRIADLVNRRFEIDSVLRIPKEEAQKQKSARVRTGDVLVSRSGTLGLGVAITKELHHAIFGSYFIRVRPNEERVDPEYLALYLNAACGALQVERMYTGGIQMNLTIPAIENIFVVFGNRKWQSRYIELLMQSIDCRNESRRFLEKARLMVEEAILEGTD